MSPAIIEMVLDIAVFNLKRWQVKKVIAVINTGIARETKAERIFPKALGKLQTAPIPKKKVTTAVSSKETINEKDKI